MIKQQSFFKVTYKKINQSLNFVFSKFSIEEKTDTEVLKKFNIKSLLDILSNNLSIFIF